MILQNITIRKNAYTLKTTSEEYLGRHLQEVAKVVSTFFMRSAAQQRYNQFLLDVADESKTRRTKKLRFLEGEK